MGTTTDPDDPGVRRGVDDQPVSMSDTYLVLSDEERAKGFVRPLRFEYVHVGRPGPEHPLVDLTAEQQERYAVAGYVKFEPYPPGSASAGRFWTQEHLDAVGKGCGAATTMHRSIAETYARQPTFYGATFCVGCRMHRPVGADGEFVWKGTRERVGT